MKQKKPVLILLAILLVVAGLLLWQFMATPDDSPQTADKRKLDNFNYIEPGAPACAALTPGCGYCPGEVIDKECYVTQAQFDEYKDLYPDLQAD